MNIEIIGQTLREFKNALSLLNQTEFTTPIKGLSGSTIGEHTRHIIELFQCLYQGYADGNVNYDTRARNKHLQTQVDAALEALSVIIQQLPLPDKKLTLWYQLDTTAEAMNTSFYRELLYNFEHCVHHQALIKVGLVELEKSCAKAGFGVAVSTARFREKCAQ
jgi:hypothetical protein